LRFSADLETCVTWCLSPGSVELAVGKLDLRYRILRVIGEKKKGYLERVKKCVSRSGEWKRQSRKASEFLGVRLLAEDVACDRLYPY